MELMASHYSVPFQRRSQSGGELFSVLTCSVVTPFYSAIFIGIAVLILMLKTSGPLRWEHRMYEGTFVICTLSMVWLLAVYMYSWTDIGSRIISVFHKRNSSNKRQMAPQDTLPIWMTQRSDIQRTAEPDPMLVYVACNDIRTEEHHVDSGSRRISDTATTSTGMPPPPPPSRVHSATLPTSGSNTVNKHAKSSRHSG